MQGAIAAAAAAGNNAAVSSSREVSGALLKDVSLPPASVAGTHNTAGSGSLQSAHHNNGAAQDGSGGGSGLNGSVTGIPVGPFGQALADAGPSLGAMTHASAGSLAVNQPLLSALRSEMMSTSIASLDQLGTVRDVPDTASNSGHGGRGTWRPSSGAGHAVAVYLYPLTVRGLHQTVAPDAPCFTLLLQGA